MDILTWVTTGIANDRNRSIMFNRLQGKTLAEIGEQYGVSRERIRQIEVAVFKQKPTLDEDNLPALYWFTEYGFLSYKEFSTIFQLPEYVYHYYGLLHKRNYSTKFIDMYQNQALSADQKDRLVEQFPKTPQYKEKHWHDAALECYKDVFANNPHGQLTIVDVTRKPVGQKKRQYVTYFVCKCSCGKIVEVSTNNLARTQSCGCRIQNLQDWIAPHNCRKVRNVETGDVFDSIQEASVAYNIGKVGIIRTCQGLHQTAGGYHWEYVGPRSLNKVRCIETGEIFPSISAAQKSCGGSVYNVLNGKAITAGGYHWEYVDSSRNDKIRTEHKSNHSDRRVFRHAK